MARKLAIIVSVFLVASIAFAVVLLHHSEPRPAAPSPATRSAENTVAKNPEARVANLSPRNAEVIESVLRSTALSRADDRIYFLTVTPIDDWGSNGDWIDLPSDFHARIFDLPIHFRPASGAYLHDGNVLVRQTNAAAWMEWITIKRWISDTEVEVEDGVWCCPLGGGQSTSIYEKKDRRGD